MWHRFNLLTAAKTFSFEKNRREAPSNVVILKLPREVILWAVPAGGERLKEEEYIWNTTGERINA